MTDPVQPSPGVPDPDAAPLSLEKTPSHFPVTAQYVANKLAKRDETRGVPVIPKKWTPVFLAGFVLCGAVTSVVVGDPNVPNWLIKASAIGSLFFGGLLGIGPGLRK